MNDWSELLADEDEDVNQDLRADITIGRPMGDDSFVNRIQEMTGRNLRKGKSGRAAKNRGEFGQRQSAKVMSQILIFVTKSVSNCHDRNFCDNKGVLYLSDECHDIVDKNMCQDIVDCCVL